MTRRKPIVELEPSSRHLELVRILHFGDTCRGVAHQRLPRHEQQPRILLLGALAPALERRRRMDFGRHALGVEREQRFVVHQHVLATRLVLERCDVGDEFAVVREEWRLRIEVACDQCLAQEHFACRRRLGPSERHAAARDQGKAIQRDALESDDLAARAVPTRIEKRALDPIAGNGLDPFWLDPRGAAGVQPRRLGQLRRKHPFRAFFREPRPGMKVELEASRAEIRIGA